MSASPSPLPGTPPVRFIVLGDARTGSNVLVEALNSHPHIVCFREALNFLQDGIDYAVDGYDQHSAADIDLRARDPMRFVNERLFSGHAPHVAAAGFKFHYAHLFGSQGIIEGLMADRGLRIIHLQRKNALRSLVSRRIAEATGMWLESGPQGAPLARAEPAPAPSLASTLRSTIGRLRRGGAAEGDAPPATRITLTREECLLHFHVLAYNITLFDSLFDDHRKMSVYYEDIVSGDEAQAAIQRFLGVEPVPLRVRMRRQNPQPLSQLIENFEEMRRAFADTRFAGFFEE